ncbi:hypothetical protein COLO4_04035 [Corchorus olitorius]|uniref:Rho termination factor-like N-terminal domain-containing protein n=1 Tax=Corchorus olitorius TaxID=93759 RepID=A0A1R3KVP0_9ROSI|nr:hypothetical protein COLO4_04035 [Corchorus olitorius]
MGHYSPQNTKPPLPQAKERRRLWSFFRKVQAQLRERAAPKADKKTEALAGKSKESGTVDSLLKLLRKHSEEQGKRQSSIGSRRDQNLDVLEVNGSSNEEKSSSFFDSNNRVKSEAKEPYVPGLPTFSRPASNFQRKPPVSQVKYQPMYTSEETVNSATHINSDGKRKSSPADSPPAPDDESELEDELESETEAELDPEAVYEDPDALDELAEDESSDIEEDEEDQGLETAQEDLSALKLPELKALAKSRGLKGFSKMKKSDLVELLSSTPV